jgi:hypothetical protein
MRKRSFFNLFKKKVNYDTIVPILKQDIELIEEVYTDYLEYYKFFNVDSLIEVQELIESSIKGIIIVLPKTRTAGLYDFAMQTYTNFNLNSTIKNLETVIEHLDQGKWILMNDPQFTPRIPHQLNKASQILGHFVSDLRTFQTKAKSKGLL